MHAFAERTGLLPAAAPPTRYLWTDAFAVCNYLGLFLACGEQGYLDLARRLIDQVHQTLGRHRSDDTRRGWISGLDEEEGARHPTLGGLRIGKPLPERRATEPIDPEAEWDRDGQYFHYLTKWMHALERTAQVANDPTYHAWAFELAKTACARFSVPRRGIYWKMSIDLSRPLVASMGHHDPLDGFVTYQQIQESRPSRVEFDLGDEIAVMAQLCSGRDWVTDDMLGIGGLLCDAWRLARLPSRRAQNAALSVELLEAAERGLGSLALLGTLDHPAEVRLAFREFGLAIGLRATRELRGWVTSEDAAGWATPEAGAILRRLVRYEPLADGIERFWSSPTNQASRSWAAHRDINEVMFATSLAPRGFLGA